MGNSWYKKSMPSVSDISNSIDKIVSDISSIPMVKEIHVFGSYADNIHHPDTRIKDIDIIVSTPFYSEDLVSITKDVFGIVEASLEEEGFDYEAVKFSQALEKIDTKFCIDKWAISCDDKLLHWGPIITSRTEADDIKKEAEEFASSTTGFNLKKLQKSSVVKQNEWMQSFKKYLHSQLEDMPSGWYCSLDADIDFILRNAIKLTGGK
jgi:predicted nucleotidyltransferase